MENEDQKPTEDGQDPKPAEGTASSGDSKTPPEGFVSTEQFNASRDEALRLRKEIESLKTPPQNKDLPEDKKRIFEYLSEYEKQKIEEAKKEEEQFKSSLDKLHSIHGDFNDEKLKGVISEYGVYTEEGDINWEKAIDLYKKLGNKVVKKSEIGQRTQDGSQEVDKVNVRGKNMYDLVQDGLKKFGMGK